MNRHIISTHIKSSSLHWNNGFILCGTSTNLNKQCQNVFAPIYLNLLSIHLQFWIKLIWKLASVFSCFSLRYVLIYQIWTTNCNIMHNASTICSIIIWLARIIQKNSEMKSLSSLLHPYSLAVLLYSNAYWIPVPDSSLWVTGPATCLDTSSSMLSVRVCSSEHLSHLLSLYWILTCLDCLFLHNVYIMTVFFSVMYTCICIFIAIGF